METFVPRSVGLANNVEGARTCDPLLPDVPVSSDVLESTEESGSLKESLRSVLPKNPSISVSLSPCSLFLDNLGVAMHAGIVLVSIRGLLNSSSRFLLAWPVCHCG